MMILEGITLNLEFQVGLLDNSWNHGSQYQDDWGRTCYHTLLSYWKGVCCIREKSSGKCAFFTLTVPNSLRKEDVPGNEHYKGTDKVVEGKTGLDLLESIFQFKGRHEEDTTADESGLNEAYAKEILRELSLELLDRVNLPFKFLNKVIWIDTKTLLDQGVIIRPGYQMEMLAEDEKVNK